MIMLEFAVLFLTLEFRLVCYLFIYFWMICWNWLQQHQGLNNKKLYKTYIRINILSKRIIKIIYIF